MAKPNNRPPRAPPSGRTNLASCIVATIFLIFVAIVILIVFFTVFKPKDPKISVNAVQLPSFAISNNTVNFTFSQYVAVNNPNRAAFSHYDSTIQLIYSGSQVGFMFIPAGQIESGRTQYMAATFTIRSFPISSTASATTQQPVVTTPGNNVGFGYVPIPATPNTAVEKVDGFSSGSGIDPVVNSGSIPGLGPVVTGGGGIGGVGIGGVGTGTGFGGVGRVGPSMELQSRMEMAGRVRVLHVFTHHVEAKVECRVGVSVTDGSVLGFHC
ncbi:hypothetical protein ACFE04_004691 [Oxalis oulophora]